jgi:hypothetical protein
VIASAEEEGEANLTEGLVTALFQHRVLVDASPRFRAV